MRYITQILTGKHIARSCEDVDETVLSAAQFKAAATDNPMVAQKMELENRVTELKILRGAWSNEQLALEHKVMEAPDRWADLGFANLLGRYEEAKAHNAPHCCGAATAS